jgi:hypothetical protein
MPKAKDPATSRTSFPSDEQEKFVLRLPDGMRDRIAKAASASGRSMNAEIVHRMEESLGAVTKDDGHSATLLHWLFLRAQRIDAQAELDQLKQRPAVKATEQDIARIGERLLAVRRLMGALEMHPVLAQALGQAAEPRREARETPRGGSRKKTR